jgi:hypothetical protein
MINLPPREVSDVRANSPFLQVSEEYAIEIGYVSVFWAMADEMLASTAHALMDHIGTDVGVAVTAELSSVGRIALITALMASVRNREWFDRWIMISDAADDIRVRRNEITHGMWAKYGDEHKVLRVKARMRVSRTMAAVSVADVRKLKDETLDLIDALGDFMGLLIKNEAHKRLRGPHVTPPLTRGLAPSERSQAQTRNRIAKQARKQADRERSAAAHSSCGAGDA